MSACDAAEDLHAGSEQPSPEISEAWTTVQVDVFAVSGLASTHTTPFARVVYAAKSHDKKHRSDRLVSVDSPSLCQLRQRERDGRFTALWAGGDEEDSSCQLQIPTAVDWIEVQIWNHFANDVDVFLGTTSVSLLQLRAAHHRDTQSTTKNASQEGDLCTGATWYPLQTSKQIGLARLRLSVQLGITFHRDVKAYRMQQQIARKLSSMNEGSSVESEDAGGRKEIVDPTFTFTEPCLPLDWSPIVSTSIRHIFFHASIARDLLTDIERLRCLYQEVLYGDLAQELDDEDSDVCVHEDHLKAFKLCQFSTQYLDHCISTLTNRCEEYGQQYQALAQRKQELLQKQKRLKENKRRVQKQHRELDLLVTTYERLLESERGSMSPDDKITLEGTLVQPRSPQKLTAAQSIEQILRDPSASSSSPEKASISSQKPAFLMTWEERERQRKLEKEKSKSKRIEDEKQRLAELLQARNAQQDQQARMQALLERTRHKSATKLQDFVRTSVQRQKARRFETQHLAAIHIQSQFRRFVQVKRFPRVLLAYRRQINELQSMGANEMETRAFLEAELEQKRIASESNPAEQSHFQSDDEDNDSPSAKMKTVDALVFTWRKLRQIFLSAHSMGADFHELYSKLDERGDGTIDRAEFRRGIRAFGVRIDRKLTRALIALLRTKCGDQARPLQLTFEHFHRGFDFQRIEAPRGDNSIDHDHPNESSNATPRSDYIEPSSSESQNAIIVQVSADKSPKSKDQVEAVSEAIRVLRQRILDAAKDHMEALGKPVSDYFAYREALKFVFEEFDEDGNGQLELEELVTCVRSIGFEVTDQNLSLIRECFLWDPTNEEISIDEFISFALTRPGNGDEELGILGSRIRDALLQHIKQARQETDSIEEAVRLVFRAAYQSRSAQSCSNRQFMKVLSSLQLGWKPAQLARLIVRLDQNGDNEISFDELLIWLRIRKGGPNIRCKSSVTSEGLEELLDRNALAVQVRQLLLKEFAGDESRLLAWFHGLPSAISTVKSSLNEMKVRTNEFKQAVRNQIGPGAALSAIDAAIKRLDANSSGWVTTRELQQWAFPLRDLEELTQLITKEWQQEWSSHYASVMSTQDFAVALYSRFDGDQNGVLAQQEIRAAFVGFRVALREAEVQKLMQPFDLDEDGCWSKQEFIAFVHSIFPTSKNPTLDDTSHAADERDESFESSSKASSKYEDDDFEHDNGPPPSYYPESAAPDLMEYSDDLYDD